MSAVSASPPLIRPAPLSLGSDTLHAVIGAVAQGPDLDRVLPAIVELLVEATACHACFVYLREGDSLRMRGASAPYTHVVGRVALSIDEGLCGWVARHGTPAFIRENALADPRMRYVPELEEERFQSMVAVPLLDRGAEVIGVVVLHTEAPREFGADVLDFLVHVASLVAGAVDNARLYDDTRRWAARLAELAALGGEIAAAGDRGALYRSACEGVNRLLGVDATRLFLRDGAGRLELAAHAGPEPGPEEGTPTAAASAPGSLAVPLSAGEEELGLLAVAGGTPAGAEELRLLDAVANQVAVSLQKVDLVERLTEENLVRALFDDLEAGRASSAESRARAAGYDLGCPHVVVLAEPAQGAGDGIDPVEQLEGRLRRVAPRALCDPGPEGLRALVPFGAGGPPDRLARMDEEVLALAHEQRLVVGRSELRRGLGVDLQSLAEARCALRVARALEPEGGLRAHEELGVFRYLGRLPAGGAPDERHAGAIERLGVYDRRRRSELLRTLERYLAERGGIAAAARALFVHPNTLRQRLERIEEVTGLELAGEDLLSLELALHLARLDHAG